MKKSQSTFFYTKTIKKVIKYMINNSQTKLISNINKIHTTELGVERIKKNLNTDNNDIIKYLKKLILDEKCLIYKKGKNYYCEINSIRITINSYSYCIITAHVIKKWIKKNNLIKYNDNYIIIWYT